MLERARDRGGRLHRIAMRLDHADVWHRLQPIFEHAHAAGVLEQPAALVMAADQAQQIEFAQEARLLVLRRPPGVIGGGVPGAGPAVADEALALQFELFVQLVGDDIVRDRDPGGFGMLVVQPAHRASIAGVVDPGLARRARHRRGGQPVLHPLELRVHPHQLVEDGRARARQAGDQDRFHDRRGPRLGMALPPLLGGGAGDQRHHHRVPRQLAPRRGEARIGVHRGEQYGEARPVAAAEVGEPAQAMGYLVEIVLAAIESRGCLHGGIALPFSGSLSARSRDAAVDPLNNGRKHQSLRALIFPVARRHPPP